MVRRILFILGVVLGFPLVLVAIHAYLINNGFSLEFTANTLVVIILISVVSAVARFANVRQQWLEQKLALQELQRQIDHARRERDGRELEARRARVQAERLAKYKRDEFDRRIQNERSRAIAALGRVAQNVKPAPPFAPEPTPVVSGSSSDESDDRGPRDNTPSVSAYPEAAGGELYVAPSPIDSSTWNH